MRKGTTRSKAPMGQNFLTSHEGARAIVEALGDMRDRLVIEIGPGRGALTDMLMVRAGRLVAIELDPRLVAGLELRYAGRQDSAGSNISGSFVVIRADVLKVNLRDIVERYGDGKPALVVGNLPYYITSDILLRLLAQQEQWSTAVLMMQREVAERVVASPGGREYGLLTATVQMHATAETILTLPPEAFSPPPQVYSTVVRLHAHPRFAELKVSAAFVDFLKLCFQQKRKTLANNLRASGFADSAIAVGLTAAGIAAEARAETISLERMAELYHSLEQERAEAAANFNN